MTKDDTMEDDIEETEVGNNYNTPNTDMKCHVMQLQLVTTYI